MFDRFIKVARLWLLVLFHLICAVVGGLLLSFPTWEMLDRPLLQVALGIVGAIIGVWFATCCYYVFTGKTIL